MASRSFRWNCAFRVSLLAVTALVGAGLLVMDLYASLFLVVVLLAYQVWSLVRYVEFTNRNLDLFLKSIEFSDFSHSLAQGPGGKSFTALAATFDDVTRKFREINAGREENLRYLHSVVQHIGIGLLAFDQEGKVVLLNPVAKTLLGVPALRNVGDLEAVQPELHGKLRDLRAGQPELVTVAQGDRLQHLSLRATEMKRQGEALTIVSIQNISLELNEKEMEAWRDLIRVLTHEIRNSLTPIGSLAASVEEMIVGDSESAIADSGSASQSRVALQAIQRRSEGLLQFVSAYRDLTHIPAPAFESLKVSELFSQVRKLIAPQLGDRDARLCTAVRPEGMTLMADPRLIEQVLINLLLNALQATEGQADAEILLEAATDAENRPVIRVTDNGPGIPIESLEQIFVPFYSTRQGGSGIGLSLSRQIMRLHRGDLMALSEPGVRTTFTLQF
jgi:nitrogen fixation/metabolism regulation signal transduction histidine kinase